MCRNRKGQRIGDIKLKAFFPLHFSLDSSMYFSEFQAEDGGMVGW